MTGSVDAAARQVLWLMAKGEQPDPLLHDLLLDALERPDRSDRPRDRSARVSAETRAATEWIGASAKDRDRALCDLLRLADALPPNLGEQDSDFGLPEKVLGVDRAFSHAGLDHGFGGALAVAYYGVPRATLDVDVNVFVEADRAPAVGVALAPLGVDVEIDRRELHRDRDLELPWGENPIHVFFSHDDLHREMKVRVRRVPFAGATIPLIAPEHLVARKACLDRSKDWLDIEQILVATAPLDLDEIEGWLLRMVGDEDERLRKLRDLREQLSV